MDTKIKLPSDYINKMKNLLGDEFDDYMDSFNSPASKAVHLNTNLLSNESFQKMFTEEFEMINGTGNCYKSLISNIGYHPLFHSGLIYSQDPSAMMPIEALPNILPKGALALDLCAAPGGKTSQLAIKLNEINGYLLSNEPNVSRNKILKSNIERMGFNNVSVSCAKPDEIAALLPGAFSLIVIDAPCSGEGMFRKYPDAPNEWSVQNVKMCSERQKEIINSIMPALRDGGYILYSTCTYSREEDEEIIEYMTENHNLSYIEPTDYVKKNSICRESQKGFVLYPHKFYGEGQFLCLLKKNGSLTEGTQTFVNSYKKISRDKYKLFEEIFTNGNLPENIKDCLYEVNNKIIYVPNSALPFASKIMSSYGFIMGEADRNRLIPHHQLFKILGSYLENEIELSNDTAGVNDYLKGLELSNNNAKNGYGIIKYNNAVLGGFKCSGGRLKNHYPKGLRNLH